MALNLFCTTNLPGESSIPNHHPPGNSRNINYVQHSIFITRFNLKQTFEKHADQASTNHLSGVCCSDSPGFSYHSPLGFTDSYCVFSEGYWVILLVYQTARQDQSTQSSTKPLGTPSINCNLNLVNVYRI